MASKQDIPLFIAPPAVAAFCWLISNQCQHFDRELFVRLSYAFGSPSEMLVAKIWQDRIPQLPAADLASCLLLSTFSVLAGYKLAAVARCIVFAQILALSLLLQWIIWHVAGYETHPLLFFLPLPIGVAVGYVMRRVNLQRKKSEAQYYELTLRNRELQETKLQIVKQDEVERRMLAADLHDQVLNDLKAIVHKFDEFSGSAGSASGSLSDEQQANKAEQIRVLLGQAMSEIREVMDSLCPSALEHLGLVAAIEDCLRRGGERAGFKGRVRSKLNGTNLDSLSMVEQSLLYRLVQESITNICKHAGASTVRTNVDMEDEHLVIRVADDGKGIDKATWREDSRGVRYMRQRADLIGATIAWRPGDGDKGTVVEIRMDLSGRRHEQTVGS
jgi:signal transduction histidine kinase